MVTIEELFTEKRFPTGWKLIPVLIYLPVGLVLATIRVFIGIQTIIAASLLYKLSTVRSIILRCMCGILGIFVVKENEEVEDESVKIIVSNHVSVFDHLAIHLIRDSVSILVNELPSFLHYALNHKSVGSYRNQEVLVQDVKNLIDDGATINVQPEMGITSGQKGLLRFSTWPCKLSQPIQPVVIRIWRPPLMDISSSVINSSWPSDVFWFLFVPFTVFTIKYIPVVKQTENESAEEMSKRLEKCIANELKIVPTNFTVTDKIELEKRLSTEMTTAKRPPPANVNYALLEMASKVKEVLPDVPLGVICNDLARTNSVDVTIANFLEGLVKYTPERNPASVPVPNKTASDKRKSSLNAVQPSTSLDTSPKIFHKSAEERMISFQERKLKLIETARQRYIEKHALNIMNSS